jgi:hypothetical protein
MRTLSFGSSWRYLGVSILSVSATSSNVRSGPFGARQHLRGAEWSSFPPVLVSYPRPPARQTQLDVSRRGSKALDGPGEAAASPSGGPETAPKSVVTSLAGFESGAGPAVGLLAGFASNSLPSRSADEPRSLSFQLAGGRFAANSGCLLNTPQRPACCPKGDNLPLFLVAQDIAHVAEDHPPRPFQCPECSLRWPVLPDPRPRT